MSIRSNVIVVIITLSIARAAAAEPERASLPLQLRYVTDRNVLHVDSAVAVFRDPQGNLDVSETTALSASYRLADGWASTIRLGFGANDAPGAALDGVTVGNPIVGATHTRTTGSRRLALFAAVAIPIGSGGGNDPDPRAAKTNAASITARPNDEVMFAVDDATAIIGADVAYTKRGVTAQAEASLLQSVRVRGDETTGTDAFRTRVAMGAHVGMYLGRHLSLGGDLEYRRGLDDDLATLTASIGTRVHFDVGEASFHPGLWYTRGVSNQTNAVAIAIPVLF
jgi:hypothetical protein